MPTPLKVLFTGDWQAQPSNLHFIDRAVDEMLELASRHGVGTIVHLGDWKQHYNPVDVRVVNHAMATVSRITKSGIALFVLRGNHDRVSTREPAEDWLPALREAGAVTISKVTKRDGIVFAPYCDVHAASACFAAAAALAGDVKPILAFHHDVATGRVAHGALGVGVPVEALRRRTYSVCVGGHVHRHQQLAKNVWYCGTPFGHDWGDVDADHGYLLVDGGNVEFLRARSDTPRYFSAHNARKARTDNHYVKEAPKETAVREIQTKSFQSWLRSSYGDGWERVYALSKRYYQREAAEFGGTIKLVKASARNALSFRKVTLRPSETRTLLSGWNEDWNSANGAGKTSLLSLPLIALFGRTVKNQQFDEWACSKNDEPAMVSATFERSDGRVLKIKRTRRPAGLSVSVDGVEEPLGNNAKEASLRIGALTGLTADTVLGINYIDAATAAGLLALTAGSRQTLLGRMAGLDAFSAASERVRADSARLATILGGIRERLSDVQSAITATKDAAREVTATVAADIRRLRKQIKELEAQAVTIPSPRDRFISTRQKLHLAEAYTESAARKVLEWENKKGRCPECEQTISDKLRKKKLKAFREKEAHFREEHRHASHWAAKEEKLERARAEMASAEYARRSKVAALHGELAALRRTAQPPDISPLLRKRRVLREKIEKAERRAAQFKFLADAFGRKGYPAHVVLTALRDLNDAAARISKTVSRGTIMVRFAIVNGVLDVDVQNAHGGAKVKDQSRGESRVASLIVAFAAYEVFGRLKMLVLDEPTDGLDKVNVDRVVSALERLNGDGVFIVSHSQSVMDALTGNRVHVVKENGVSCIR